MAEARAAHCGEERPEAPAPPRGVPSGRRHFVYMGVAAALLILALMSAAQFAALLQPSLYLQPEEWVDLTEPATPAPPPRDVTMLSFRFAAAPVMTPERMVELYRPFVEYVAARVGRVPVFVQGRSSAEINELLRNGQCDAALVGSHPFLRGEREFGLQALAVPRIRGATTHRSLVVARAESAAQSLLDLRGRRFACVDFLSTTGWAFPAVWLREHGAEPTRFFGDVVFTDSHDRALRAVATDYADAAAVDSVIYDRVTSADPSVGAALKVILESPPLGMPPIAVPATMEPALRDALRAALLGAHEDQRGAEILGRLEIDCFVEPDAHLYDGVRAIVETLEARRP
jgi:phosphonate transport system substrate-binding protein